MTENRKALDEYIDFDEIRRKKSHCETIIEVNNKWIIEHPGESDPIQDRLENDRAAAEIAKFEAILATEPPPPELPPRQPLFKVSGVIEEFSVQKVIGYFTEREYNPEAFAREEERNQIGALLLAMTGNTAGSAVTGQSGIRQDDRCDFVRGKINGIPFHGWLGKTDVQVGDYIEMAVMGQGNHYVVFAIMLPKLCTISMTPRCYRGREAEISVLITRVFPAFYSSCLVFALIMHFKGVEWRDTAIGAAICAGVLLPAFLATIYKIRSKTSPVTLLAEDIFAALGFVAPKKVDLRKLTKKRLKQSSNDISTLTDREMPSRRSALRYFHYY